ncbi:MAG: hypothetical protein GY737_18070, partial [Desulfobacteraceae bacterium]|nr:hypothetical protein [Desulfobacteraceae bacterium]
MDDGADGWTQMEEEESVAPSPAATTEAEEGLAAGIRLLSIAGGEKGQST